jgi:acetate kinase
VGTCATCRPASATTTARGWRSRFSATACKYLGAYLAALEGADAVVFTGGMGAHSPEIRARIVAGFEWCGLDLDDGLNRAALGVETAIGADSSAIRALVIPADEERVIARETAACLTYLGTLRCRVP